MNTPINCIVTFALKMFENNSKQQTYANMIKQSARMLKLLWQPMLDMRLIEENLLKLKYMAVTVKNATILI